VSDGTHTPREVVELALQKNLSAIAVTDHDTTCGIMETVLWGEKKGLEVIPGIELSTQYMGEEVHLLGFLFDYTVEWFTKRLKIYKNFREKREHKMIELLNKHGISITFEEVLKEGGNASLGRPHIARVMVKRGFVKNVQEAFDKYLVPGKPGFAPKFKLPTDRAINFIHELGGITCIAHPIYNNWKKIIPALLHDGLDGIEAIHPSHNRIYTEYFIQFAKDNNMLISGGSDFHTAADANNALDSVRVGYSYLEEMKMRQKDNSKARMRNIGYSMLDAGSSEK